MSELQKHRIKQNLTQEELANKSNVSVRTIQRLENGIQPKGFTLKALAKALEINEDQLKLNDKEKIEIDTQLFKIINFSSLPFIIFPPLNIIVPLLIIYYKKQSDPIIKHIVSIQFIWTIVSFIIFMLSVFIKKWLLLNNMSLLLIMAILVVSDIYIILRNAIEINKSNKLHFQLKFNLL